MTSYERTGWRDAWPSEWHRQLGSDFPMTDVDGLWFDRLQPVAILDWKYQAASWKPHDASLQAQCNLANAVRSDRCPHGLPFFVVEYTRHPNPTFNVYAMNDAAAAALISSGPIQGQLAGYPLRRLNEVQFVHLAGMIRGLPQSAVTKAIAGLAMGVRSAAPTAASSITGSAA